MIIKYPKASQQRLTDHFGILEFHCHCAYTTCTFTYIDTDLLLALEELRQIVGPLRVLSGFRCSAYNHAVGGKPGSYHMLGKAVDVSAKCKPSYLAFQAEGLSIFRSGGVGKYFSFVHLDNRGYKARWAKYVQDNPDDDSSAQG